MEEQTKPEETRRYSRAANRLYHSGIAGVTAGLLTIAGSAFYQYNYNPKPETPTLTARVQKIDGEIAAIYSKPLTFREYADVAYRDSLTVRVNSLENEKAMIKSLPEFFVKEKDYRDRITEFNDSSERIGYVSLLCGAVFAVISLIPYVIGYGMREREDNRRKIKKREERAGGEK